MNSDMIASLIRWLMSAVGGYLIAHGMSQGDVTGLTNWLIMGAGVLPVLISVIWGLFKHTNASTVKAAAAIPGINIDVLKAAPDGAQQVAKNPKITNVNQK